MKTSGFDKFGLLMWKNWLLQWRHKVQTIVEILTPVVFCALLVLIRSLVDPETVTEPVTFGRVPIDSTLSELREMISNQSAMQLPPLIDRWELAYSPQNPYIDALMTETTFIMNLDPAIGRANSLELESYLTTNRIVAGIDFGNELSLTTSLPTNLSYAVRYPSELRSGRSNPLIFNWRTDILFPVFQTGGPRNRNETDGGLPSGYSREGFLAIQNSIAAAFLKIQGSQEMPTVFMRRFPYPEHIRDPLLQGLEAFVSLIILLSFVYPCINTVKFITTEKEKQLKEAMKIMGLPNWLHWTAWFVKMMMFLVLSITLMTVLLKVRWYADSDVSVFTHSHWSTIWIFLFVYSISTVMYCFMLSVFFSKANTAASVAGLVWFIFYAPFSFTVQNYEQLTFATKMGVSIFSNTAMAFGFQVILRHEGNGNGLQWNNMWSPVTVDDNLAVGHMIIMLLVSSVLYLLITLYVEKVMPGEFGVPEKWYFPFTRKFWCKVPEYVGVEDVNQTPSHLNPQDYEVDPVGKNAGVQVKNLRKVYSNKKVAVHGLTLNMFDDQITVLLGHNGAGKTTTMSMLTGMFPPTSGTAIISGKDLRTELAGIRESIGLCPQHNILFDELTVREHIVFYSKLKGLKKQDIDNEINKYVKLLELEPKINAQSHSLSGGMKRKLSVGVALCGGSKVVLCDEPTSGMDPAARRALWDLLQREKQGRTILLSTHFMDEADILGDRIAIMSNGELKCSGSSFFLKKRFGVGYHLVCVKSSNCNSSDMTNLLSKYVPGISIESDIGTELSYQLPEEFSNKFKDLLMDLEDNSERMGVSSFGISLTTLEEVFMKVGTDPFKEDKPVEANGNGQVNTEVHRYDSEVTLQNDNAVPLLSGYRLVGNQWVAMFYKKIWNSMRNWILLFLQIIIPIAFIIITVLIVRTWQGFSSLPNLDASLDSYGESFTTLEDQSDAENTVARNIVVAYQNMFKMAGSVGQHLNTITSGFTEYILDIGRQFQTRVNNQYMVAATVHDNFTVQAWFNNEALHTAPLSINLLHNAIIKSFLGEGYSIDVSNRPLPFTIESRTQMLQAGNNMGFQLASNLGFAMAFVSSFYILFYVKERESRAKLLQFVSGVNVLTFWVSAFVWDMVTFIITILLTVGTLAIFQEDGWATFDELGRTFLVLLLFGWAMLPMIYLASLLFSVPSTGFVRMALFNIFTGIALFFVIFIMSNDQFELEHVAAGLSWAFLIFPHFSLSHALSNLNVITTLSTVCSNLCDQVPECTPDLVCLLLPNCCQSDFFAWEEPGIGRNLVYMFVVGIVFFFILMLIEYRIFEILLYKGRHLYRGAALPESEDGFVDSDVRSEKQRIQSMSPSEVRGTSLVLNRMTKLYGNFLAVNQISVAVEESECFGLLGVNGAGKTSTFKMLTGDEKISSGEAFVKGLSLTKQMNDVHKEIGYCPQFDALIDDLTGRETLKMYCLLRGVPNSMIAGISKKLAGDLNFLQHLDKKVKEYSGGNKRKLSTAVSLVGNPSVVYLDEPTTGMDPGAKRHLWNMLCKVRNSGKSIVLTSHSMEECEALCTRLAIMVNGEFKCLGSTQHLKSKFSIGFVLTIKIRKESKLNQLDNANVFGEKVVFSVGNESPTETPTVKRAFSENVPLDTLQTYTGEQQREVENVKEFVMENFTGATLREDYQGMLTFFIANKDLKWSHMFGLMEDAKESLNIEDYSLSQTSLEQVFLSFTKYQRDEVRPQSS